MKLADAFGLEPSHVSVFRQHEFVLILHPVHHFVVAEPNVRLSVNLLPGGDTSSYRERRSVEGKMICESVRKDEQVPYTQVRSPLKVLDRLEVMGNIVLWCIRQNTMTKIHNMSGLFVRVIRTNKSAETRTVEVHNETTLVSQIDSLVSYPVGPAL